MKLKYHLKAIYSDDLKGRNLVLKRWQWPLKLYNITDSSSQDLDFSIKESIRYEKKEENRGKKLQGFTIQLSSGWFFSCWFEFIESLKKRKETCLHFEEDLNFFCDSRYRERNPR